MFRRLWRHKSIVIAVVVLALAVMWLFAIMPLALDREVGWTGLLVIGDQTGNQATLSCPLTVTDDQGQTHPGYLVTIDGGTWTRFDLPPGHYALHGVNVDQTSVTI